MRMLGFKTVRRLMWDGSKTQVTHSAVVEMQQSLETISNNVIVLAKNLLDEENIFRKIQGLPQKVRLSDEYVKKAFETIFIHKNPQFIVNEEGLSSPKTMSFTAQKGQEENKKSGVKSGERYEEKQKVCGEKSSIEVS